MKRHYLLPLVAILWTGFVYPTGGEPAISEGPTSFVAPKDKALVVFVRTAKLGKAVYFYVLDENKKLVTLLKGNQHVAIKAPPGKHTFYVVSENAGLVRAELAGFPLPAGLDADEEFTGIPAEDTVLLIQPAAVPEKHTLVVTSTVLDYLKGNRGLRMFGVGIGGSRFTVRFSIYDKQTGAEVARGNVTGAVEDTSFGLPGGSGSDQSLKVGAADLVYHVERRVREADR